MSIFIWVIRSKGRMSPDPRNHDFMTQRFEHGAQCELTKHEIAKHLGIRPTITAHSHMESRAIKKRKAPIKRWVTEVVQGNDPGHQIQSKSDRRSRWAISQDRASRYLNQGE
jgi:hypothetical protein